MWEEERRGESTQGLASEFLKDRVDTRHLSISSFCPNDGLHSSVTPLHPNIQFYGCPETGNLLICPNTQQLKPFPSGERGNNERFPRPSQQGCVGVESKHHQGQMCLTLQKMQFTHDVSNRDAFPQRTSTSTSAHSDQTKLKKQQIKSSCEV